MTLFVGDVLKAPPPLHPEVRFRVREIETVMKTGPWLKPIGTVKQYSLQLFTMESPGVWSWMDRSYDRHATIDTIREWGLEITEKATVQMELF